ncbi:hypothetical protein D3C80_1605710 [compost metagenome]
MQDTRPIVAVDQTPEIVQLAFTEAGPGTEDLPETLDQGISRKSPPDHPAQGAEQQFLHEHRSMRLGKQPAVEEHATGNLRTILFVPGQ